MRRIILATPALLAIGFLLAGCSWVRLHKLDSTTPPSAPVAQVGQAAPDIDAVDTTGRRLHLADYRGQVVVLNFWANW
jgi:cytochrome oxidase Cu insertion factor (SCO1/SenC/PrrC family)